MVRMLCGTKNGLKMYAALGETQADVNARRNEEDAARTLDQTRPKI